MSRVFRKNFVFSHVTAIPPSPSLLEETFKALNAMRVYSHSYSTVYTLYSVQSLLLAGSFFGQQKAAQCWLGRERGQTLRILEKNSLCRLWLLVARLPLQSKLCQGSYLFFYQYLPFFLFLLKLPLPTSLSFSSMHGSVFLR